MTQDRLAKRIIYLLLLSSLYFNAKSNVLAQINTSLANAEAKKLGTAEESIKVDDKLHCKNCPTEIPKKLFDSVNRFPLWGGYQNPLQGSQTRNNNLLWLVKEASSPSRILGYEAKQKGNEKSTVAATYQTPSSFYNFYPSPDYSLAVYNADESGELNYQLFLINEGEKADAIQITPAKTRNVEPVWNNAAKRIAYGTAKMGQEGMSLVWSDLAKVEKGKLPIQNFIFETPFMLTAQEFANDHIAFIEYFSLRGAARLWLFDLKNKELVEVTEKRGVQRTGSISQMPKGEVDRVQFSQDGKSLYFTATGRNQKLQLFVYDINSRKTSPVSGIPDANQDIGAFSLAPSGKDLAVAFELNGQRKLFVGTVETKASGFVSGNWRSVETPRGKIDNLQWSQDGGYLAFNYSGIEPQAILYQVRNESNTNSKLTPTAVETLIDVADKDTPRLEEISYKTKDGLNIKGWMYLPPSQNVENKNTSSAKGEKHPVIIELHGGPAEASEPIYQPRDMYYLTEKQAVVIYPNVRGSVSFGNDFILADDLKGRDAAVNDVLALLDWIEQQPNLDPDKVMLRGASYGGYLTLLVAAKAPKRVKAVVVESAPSNVVNYLRNTKGWRRNLNRTEYGDERSQEAAQYLSEQSPINNVKQFQLPILLAHGVKDPLIPVSEADNFASRLSDNKNFWYVRSESDGHAVYHEMFVPLEAAFFNRYVLENK